VLKEEDLAVFETNEYPSIWAASVYLYVPRDAAAFSEREMVPPTIPDYSTQALIAHAAANECDVVYVPSPAEVFNVKTLASFVKVRSEGGEFLGVKLPLDRDQPCNWTDLNDLPSVGPHPWNTPKFQPYYRKTELVERFVMRACPIVGVTVQNIPSFRVGGTTRYVFA
jgi:hypothetical protein